MSQSIKEELIETLDRLSLEKLLVVLHLHSVSSNKRLSRWQLQPASVPKKRNVRWRIFWRRLAVVTVVIPRARCVLMKCCMAAKERHECVC